MTPGATGSSRRQPSQTGPVVALVGATASGKSRVAMEVAITLNRAGCRPIELVSVDSMAVYRGMDIGTAKPTAAEREAVPYHLVDLVDPSEEFTVQQFQHEARAALAGIAERGHGALLVGGTGLYLRSVVDDLAFPGRFPDVAADLVAEVEEAGAAGGEGERSAWARLHGRLAELDPEAAARIHATNRRRILRALEVTLGSGRPFSSFGPGLERYPPTSVGQVGIRLDPHLLDDRIAARFHRLMEAGLLDEVRGLALHPAGLSRTARQGLGYRELLAHVEDGVPLADAVEEAVRRTRAFARRQVAWFRRDPRIVWVHPDGDPVAAVTACFGEVPDGPTGVGDC